jgi:hypothetical protein
MTRTSTINGSASTTAAIRSDLADLLIESVVLERWTDTGLVFTTRLGTGIDAANIRRDLRRALALVPGLNPADWTPRELRHSFVSLLSDAGVPLQEIAQLVGPAAPTSPNWSTGIRSGPSSRPAQRSWIGSSATAAQVRSHSVGHSPGRCERFGSPEPVSDLVGDTGFEPVTSSV